MARGGKPLWSFTSFGDTGCGYLSAIGVIQALYHRDKTGEGQMVDTSIINAHLLNTSYAMAYADGRGVDRPKLDGMQTGLHALYRLYECSEGWICIAAPEERHWQKLYTALKLSEHAQDARFATVAARLKNDAELVNTLEAVFKTTSAKEWFAILDAAGVPCEISASGFAMQMYDNPEITRREWVASYEHPFFGRLDQVGVVANLSDTPSQVQGPPFIVGQHTREILEELGYSEAAIQALHKAEVISIWEPGGTERLVANKWTTLPSAIEKKGKAST
jgi:crotonobetainyl-CoA:carnitine CoA-transferase CaiB-like acyl-CoA transferase